MIVAFATTAFVTFYLWVWYKMRQDWDDDDEVYFACFRPTASPVATPHAFVKILERVPVGSRILDLGIGSGTYIEHDKVRKIVKQRKLVIDGVDISAPNVAICQQRITKHGLDDHFTVVVQDARTLTAEGAYDAILFMESFPCMSIALFVDIMKGVQKLLKPSGKNFLYHNLGDPVKMGPLLRFVARRVKPVIKLFVGIDFGRMTMQQEMWDCLAASVPTANKDRTDEILLSCFSGEASIDFSGVSSWYHYCGCLLFKLVMKNANYLMEQHLITLPKEILGGSSSSGAASSKRRASSKSPAKRAPTPSSSKREAAKKTTPSASSSSRRASSKSPAPPGSSQGGRGSSKSPLKTRSSSKGGKAATPAHVRGRSNYLS